MTADDPAALRADAAGSSPHATYYTVEATVLIVGDTASAQSRAAAAAASAGLRVLVRCDPSEARRHFDAFAASRVIYIEMDETPAAPDAARAFERLLVRLNQDAASGRYASIVSTPAALIDLVAALAPDARVHQLAEATDLERVAALALAAAPASLSFRDSASENADTLRLARLTDEVARIAGALASLSARAAPAATRPAASGPNADPIDAEQIRGMIQARRMRAQYFDAELFADPAWDMLLDLAAAHADGQRVAVSSLCIAAAVPATTALRWIRTLTETGLFVRHADPADGRRVFVDLSDGAARGMRGYFDALRRLADAPGMNLAQIAV